jgi:hypothetical protein
MVGGNEWEIFFLFSGAIFSCTFFLYTARPPSALTVRLTPESNF